jgi:thiamine pyrophosphate-dependent acetolactate synthase large subunit-like protein
MRIVERVARMIAEGERPLLLVGVVVVRSGAADALQTAAETLNIPSAYHPSGHSLGLLPWQCGEPKPKLKRAPRSAPAT